MQKCGTKLFVYFTTECDIQTEEWFKLSTRIIPFEILKVISTGIFPSQDDRFNG